MACIQVVFGWRHFGEQMLPGQAAKQEGPTLDVLQVNACSLCLTCHMSHGIGTCMQLLRDMLHVSGVCMQAFPDMLHAHVWHVTCACMQLLH